MTIIIFQLILFSVGDKIMFFYKKCYLKEKETNSKLNSFNLQFEEKISDISKKIDKISRENAEQLGKLNEVTNELNAYKSLISLDTLKSYNSVIETFETKKTQLNKEIQEKENLINDYKDELKQLKGDYFDTDENEILPFKSKYAYTDSTEYETKLKEIKSQQREMKLNGQIVIFDKKFLIDNDEKNTNKFIKNLTKSTIDYFNIICQNYIRSVKITNYNKIRNDILKCANEIKCTNALLHLSISDEYIKSKIDELDIVNELNLKKEEEKEERRKLKEKLKEEEKVLKEIEERKAEIEEEEQKLLNRKNDLIEQLKNETRFDVRDWDEQRIREINDRLDEINTQREELIEREANKKIGYVYIISNIGAFGENIYKIGMTRRLEPKERITELSGASVPFKFDIHALIFSYDAPALEAKLHKAFEDKKVNVVNQRKEFFNVTLDEIKKVVIEKVDKSVKFIDYPEADEFRSTLKLKNMQKKSEQ